MSEERNPRPGGRLRAALLLPLAASLAALAEPGGISTPSAPIPSMAAPEIKQEKITLSEALRLTVDYSPDVLLFRQEVDRRHGLLQQASGAFDHTISFNPQFSRTKTVLTPSQLQPEIAKRLFFSEASQDMSVVASDIAKGLTDDKGFPLPDCQGRQYYINGSAICLDKIDPTDVQSFQALIDGQAAAASIPPDSPSQRLYTALLKAYTAQLTYTLKLLRQVFIPALNQQLAAIGGLPSLLNYDTLDVYLEYTIPTRFGLSVTPMVYFGGIHDNYADKSESPANGGKGVPTLYRSAVGFSLDLPLLKGAGRTSVTAQESSARESYNASLQSLAHAAAQSVLRTALTYWSLAAAQEQVALLERSAAAQKKINDVTSALVKADEVAKAELSRVAGRTADLEGGVAAARRDVAQKRVDLARAIGLAVPDLANAPLAADPLPSGDEVREVDAATLARLLDTALDRRADLKAANLRLTAADYVLKGTRVDLKPQLNLSLQAGYSGIYEDANFDVMSVLNPTGYARSFKGPYVGPSCQLTLTFAFPFKNNTAKGNYAQADSLVGNASITKTNLQRTIRANVVQLANALVTAAAEVRSREAAVASNQELVASTFERFRGGETNVLETLTTEQAKTQAEADLVSARLMYATRASRLRFETGSLLSYSIADGGVKFGEITPTGPPSAPGP